jgi:PEP-CTERM motif
MIAIRLVRSVAPGRYSGCHFPAAIPWLPFCTISRGRESTAGEIPLVTFSFRRFLLAACVAIAPQVSSASTIGYYLSNTLNNDAQAQAAITAAGHTPVDLPGLSAANLVGIEVLWILNGSNGNPDAEVLGNQAAIGAFVSTGGLLSFHDRNVTQGSVDANEYLPGGSGISFTTLFSNNINISTSGTLVTSGPGGTITNTTLDNGNASNDGFASLATLPAGAVPIFNNGVVTQIVDFYYPFGIGFVYYSSIPLDFHLAVLTPVSAQFRTIYAPNELAFQASLITSGPQAVPEPATLMLLASGMLGLAVGRRRRT